MRKCGNDFRLLGQLAETPRQLSAFMAAVETNLDAARKQTSLATGLDGWSAANLLSSSQHRKRANLRPD